MAITAAIKFVQGGNIGTPGVALVGDVGTNVVASNGDNTGVQRWKWSMVGVPGGSAVPTGLISDGATTTATFLPDVRGGYHLELVAFDVAGAQKKDRRVFIVNELSGRKIPPFDAEAAALNFLGQTRGWAPDMENYLRFLDLFSVGPSVPIGSRAFSQVSSAVEGKQTFCDIGSLETTTNTPTALYSWAIPAGCVADVEAIVEVNEPLTPNYAVFKQSSAVRRDGSGAPAWVGSSTPDDNGTRPAVPFVAAPVWSFSGNNLLLTVTGTADDIRWGITFQATITYEPTP